MHENDKDGIRLSKWERFINSKTLWWIIAFGAVLGFGNCINRLIVTTFSSHSSREWRTLKEIQTIMDNQQPVYFSSDLSFKSNADFGKTKSLILDIMEKYGYDKKQLLIIDIPEGVFIRSKDDDWCKLLDISSTLEEDSKYLTKMEDGEWDAVIKKHRSPINSFGNELLARWGAGS